MSESLLEQPLERVIRGTRLPTSWCPGCGIGLIFQSVAATMVDLELSYQNCVAVSGIGCSGRLAGYLDVDSLHTPHGRTLPAAEAIKMVRPDLTVLVASGDGDLASIGGNHLIHTARRNADIAVFCVNNQTYGLTGGQLAPTTPHGTMTVTSPSGNPYNPLSIQRIVTANAAYFFARSTVYHLDHLRACMRQAIQWPGFAFVEIISDCIEVYGRRLGFQSAYDQIVSFRDGYTIVGERDMLGERDLGIMKRT